MTPAGWAHLASRGRWTFPRHLQLLQRHLLDVAAGRCRRLLIEMPPRHGKSMFVSQYFASWYAAVFPDRPILLASYEAQFAATWGQRARDTFREWAPACFGLTLAEDGASRAHWRPAGRTGGMQTAGAGGALTGKGSALLLVDDPVKNAEEANSATIRERTWDWWTSTAYTRLEPDGAAIVVQTRWHEADLAGRIKQQMAEGGEQWRVVSLPALAEDPADRGEPDPLGRQPGEALWPGRFSRADLERIRTTIGSYWFSALYQQRPQPAGGTLFQRGWFRYYRDGGDHYVLPGAAGEPDRRVPKDGCWRVQFCDPAATSNERNDWFVLDTWAVTPTNDLLLLDVIREHADTTRHGSILRAAWDRWRPTLQGVENKTFGLNIIQQAKGTGLPIVPVEADTDKVSRARTASARYEAGTVYHPADAPWLAAREEELVRFPFGRNDDQVDTTAYAALYVARRAAVPADAVPVGIGRSLPSLRNR